MNDHIYKSKNITMCPDGKYRWVYELDMYKSSAIIKEVWRVFLISVMIVAAFVFVMNIRDNGLMEALQFVVQTAAILLGIFLVLSIIGYLVFAFMIGGKYCVVFEMDEEGIWRMDLADMARQIEENDIHVMIFCSPQNPSGRVWERWELEEMMKMLEAHHVDVICDEIWADLTFEGHPHTPLQDVSPYAREHVLAAYAPSKTFNIAGLIGSYHIIYNEELRRKVTQQGSLTNYNEINVLSMHALIGGYSAEGREWLQELNRTLEENGSFALDFIRREFPGITVARPQGTYMMWLDLSDYLAGSERTLEEVLHAGWDVGVGWQSGVHFEGPSHIRLNLASPLSRIQEAFRRMKEYVFT